MPNSQFCEAFLFTPGDNDSVDGALGILKDEKEAELRGKALTEMEPATSKILPVIGSVVHSNAFLKAPIILAGYTAPFQPQPKAATI